MAEMFVLPSALDLGGAASRLAKNLDALELLQRLNGAAPTPDEALILAQYTGWGDTQVRKGIINYDEEVKPCAQELISAEELVSLKKSVLSAFYTPLPVIRAIWAGLMRLGLGGLAAPLILEPSMGVGHFIGAAPPEIRSKARFVGVELNRLTARIAGALYPEVTVKSCGFEELALPENTFDVVIGNVPFGDFGVSDPTFRPRFLTRRIHDYFIAKSMTLLRPHGVMALITSAHTMDKRSMMVREWLAERGELLGAMRLPNTTFTASAGTEVVTDVLFLRRLPDGAPRSQGWTESAWIKKTLPTEAGWMKEIPIHLNRYYVKNPKQILGDLKVRNGKHGEEVTVHPRKDGALGAHMARALEVLPKDAMEPQTAAGPVFLDEAPRPDVNAAAAAKAPELWAVYLAAKELLALQAAEEGDEAEVEGARAALNTVYATAREKFKGPLARRGRNKAPADVLKGLPIYQFLQALEEPGGAPAALFRERTTRAAVMPGALTIASNALYVCLDRRGTVDMDWIAATVGRPREAVELELAGQVFCTPEGAWVTADEYLSGNLGKKLREAEAKLPFDAKMAENVAALRKAMPAPIPPGEIHVRLGAGWIPEDVVEAFVAHLIPSVVSAYYTYYTLTARYIETTAEWIMEGFSYEAQRCLESTQKWGTRRRNALDLILDCLNSKLPVIYDTVEDEGGDGERKTRQVRNNDETLLAQGKQQDIKDAWEAWIWKDAARADRLAKIYNERFNQFRVRHFSGRHLTFPGLSAGFTPYASQLAAVARGLTASQDNPAFIHEVGAGKTASGIMTAVKAVQLGLIRRALLVVPNHLIGQWGAEFARRYPGELDRLVVASKESFTKEHRATFLASIATGNAAYVVITYEQFKVLPLSDGVLDKALAKELEELQQEREALDLDEGYSKGDKAAKRRLEMAFKQRQAALEKYRVAFKDRAAAATREDKTVVTFEDMGVDLLLFDEAQALKNDWVTTKMTNVAGLARSESQRAFDARLKIHYLLGRKARVIFLTGTPITNTVAECFVMMRYLQPDLLREMGLYRFDAWAATFGEVYASIEMDNVGGFRTQSRLRYGNLPELMALLGQSWDRATVPDALRPKIAGGQMTVIKIPGSEALRKHNKSLARRMELIREGKVDPAEDNALLVTRDGRDAALFNGPRELGFMPGVWTKVDALAERVKHFHEAYAADKASQLVFCDLFTPRGRGEILTEDGEGDDEKPILPSDLAVEGVYGVIRRKLVAAGIPDAEIAYIHTAKTPAAKEALFAAVRAGTVRVLIGSTAKMGTGMNVQERLIALHHLDCPWRPADLEQRVGRIQRQGNMYKEVHVFAYVTEGSYDPVNWQFIELKAKFIRQIMAGEVGSRTADDVGDLILTYALVKAIALGDARIIDRVKLETELLTLSKQYRGWVSEQVEMRRTVQFLPSYIAEAEMAIAKLEALQAALARTAGQAFRMTVWSFRRQEMVTVDSRAAANDLFLELLQGWNAGGGKVESQIPRVIGTWRGLTLTFTGFAVNAAHRMGGYISGQVGPDTVRSMTYSINRIDGQIEEERANLARGKARAETAEKLLDQPWLHAARARAALSLYSELVHDTPALGAGQVFAFPGLN